MKQTITPQRKTAWMQLQPAKYPCVIKKILMLTCAIYVCGTLSAQSILNEDGTVYVRKVSGNMYKPEPAGFVSCKIENNRFWLFQDGVSISEKQGYCTYSDGKYIYYNNNNDIVARYVPSEGRYYITTAKGSDILKEAPYAVLLDGTLYLGSESNIRYTVEEGFDPVAVGFFLFIY